jgi:hypothetical protein
MGNNASTPLEGPIDDSFLTEDTRYNNTTNNTTNSNNVSAVSAANNTTSSTSGNSGNSGNSANYKKYKAFPGSTILEKTFCGSIDTTDPSEYEDVTLANRLLKRADILCVSSPDGSESTRDQSDVGFNDHHDHPDRNGGQQQPHAQSTHPPIPIHPSSAMLARALVSEVTLRDNPNTMTPADMTAREKKLLMAQAAAAKPNTASYTRVGMPVGAPGGIGPPAVLNSLAYALTGDDTPPNLCIVPGQSSNTQVPTSDQNKDVGLTSNFNHMMPAGPLQESRNTNVAGGHGHGDRSSGSQAVAVGPHASHVMNVSGGFNPANPHAVTIGLSLSRRSLEMSAGVGNDKTVTRQTAFDFDELQDRAYKYVSSTDATGWRAAGGERGGPSTFATSTANASDNSLDTPGTGTGGDVANAAANAAAEKQPRPDTVHIPIIHLDCPDAATVDQVIAALASGEIFIPHMAVLPEALSVSGASPPDLVVRFGCERNEDVPADEWPNWCLEFMHNQLYEYFYAAGAKWNKRPFSITLASQVRWKTVKHMNRYFAHAERVIDAWREDGPQYLDPELSYIAGGATPEEVAKPHGIYLFRNGVGNGGTASNGMPTNYFSPNFEPPYTTKMTRSLLSNVLNKSWDKKRREWTAQPIPKLVTPTLLMAAACGCSDPAAGGFMASEVTTVGGAAVNANAANAKGPAVPRHVQKLVAKMEHVEIGRNEVTLSTSNGSNTNSLMEDSMDGRDDIEEDDDDDDDVGAKPKSAMEEEKKTDEPGMEASSSQKQQQRGGPKASSRSNRSIASHATDGASEFGQSMAMSGTTVMHTNLTSNRLFSDEDWDETSDLNELDTQKEWTRKNPPNSSNSNEDNDGELRQKVAAEQSKHTQNLQAAQSLLDREKAKAKTKQSDSPGAYRKSQGVETSESLEYSTDGSSAFFREDGGGSGAGNQQYASNAAAASKSSREEDDASLSIQDSSSSVMSVVPSDEELFAVGWAKALDPGSGNFYYFTLDRSMTVWDNPLSHSK